MRVTMVLADLVYAALLMALAAGLILPRLHSALVDPPQWILALGHAAYGVVLGVRAFSRAFSRSTSKAG